MLTGGGDCPGLNAVIRAVARRSWARGHEVVGLGQDVDGVDVALGDGTALRASYVVGCDGARSVVRKAAGIEFPGSDPTMSWILAEVEMAEEPELGFRRDRIGQHAIGRRRPDEPIRLVPDLS